MVRYPALRNYYELEKTIGCGGFAKVKLATHCLTREKVAVKIMNKSCLGDDLPRIRLELDAMKNLSHHHICKLYEVIETDTHIFMILEYCSGGELFDHIVERNRLTENESRAFFRQIISAVAYLHDLGYAHRDLKPENILLDNDQTLKLIDFGLCAKPKGGLDSHLYTSCGSPTYAAPELILGKKYIGSEVDIWSMGVLLYALLCGFLPFDDDNIDTLYKKILAGRYSEPDWLSQGSKDLIRSMLRVDPKERITIQQLQNHPWVLTCYFDAVSKDSLIEFHELDKSCVAAMAKYYNICWEDMWERISKWSYDYDTSTYLLLVSRKKARLPLKLVYNRRPRLNRENNDSPVLKESIQDTPVKPSSAFNRKFQETYSVLGSRTAATSITPKIIITSEKATDKDSDEENGRCFAEPIVPTPRHRPQKRLWSPGLNEAFSPIPNKIVPEDNSDSQTKTLSPKAASSSEPTTPCTVTPQSARKLMGSIERSLQKVRNVLKAKRRKSSDGQIQVLPAQNLCNVSTIAGSDPELVMTELRRTLERKGFTCNQKGFVLRGKQDGLSFELEVFLVSMGAELGSVDAYKNCGPVVGIRRKRLKGDVWQYKKVCEQILVLNPPSFQHA